MAGKGILIAVAAFCLFCALWWIQTGLMRLASPGSGTPDAKHRTGHPGRETPQPSTSRAGNGPGKVHSDWGRESGVSPEDRQHIDAILQKFEERLREEEKSRATYRDDPLHPNDPTHLLIEILPATRSHLEARAQFLRQESGALASPEALASLVRRSREVERDYHIPNGWFRLIGLEEEPRMASPDHASHPHIRRIARSVAATASRCQRCRPQGS
jgi:hypothetical protein